MLPENDGDNINMPSVIRVPDWIEKPLGRYYLYFSCHAGCRYIRLAVADHVEGPWRIQAPGVLRAADLHEIGDFLAAPDVHVDHANRQIRIYFHAKSIYHRRLKALVGLSEDGLSFKLRPYAFGAFYFRAFPYRGEWFAMSKGGRLHRSPDGLSPFIRGRNAFPVVPGNGRNYNAPGSVRHVSIEVRGDCADIYYSRIGDAPERILKSTMALSMRWRKWKVGPPEEVIAAKETWEGANLSIVPSKSGKAATPVNQLRDPAIFRDDDGARYLFYAVAGEHGIAMGRIDPGHARDQS